MIKVSRLMYAMMVAGLAVCATTTVVHAASAPAVESVSNAVSKVDLVTLSGGKLLLKFDFKNKPKLPASFTVNNPPRIALDFPGTKNDLGKTLLQFNEGLLRNVNVVEAGGRTRVVLNLSAAASYDAKVEGNQLLLTLDSANSSLSAAAPSAEKTTHFAENQVQSGFEAVRAVDFRRGTAGEGKVIVDLSSANAGIDIKQQGKNLVLDIIKAKLPKEQERRLDVSDFGTPVQKVDVLSQGDNTRIVIDPKGLWEYSAYQTENRLIVEVKPIIEDPTKLTQGSKVGYKGEKLSLNFQNVEVRTVIQVIAEFTGLNIVTSDSVSGSLTLRLKDVPWDQALDIILQTRGLDQRKNGNVLWVAPREEIAQRDKQEFDSKQQLADSEPTRTEAFQLKYQKAETIAKMLSESTNSKSGGVLSKRGAIVKDDRTNTLFISDIPAKLDDIREILARIDVPVKQVLIEARIVEVDDDYGRTLGSRLQLIQNDAQYGWGNLTYTGRLEDDANMHPATGNPKTVLPDNLGVNLPAGGLQGFTPGSFAAVLARKTGQLIGLELSALEADGKGKVISAPRVVTANNIKAKIEDGFEIPCTKIDNGTLSVEWRKAVLSLEVVPQVTPDDKVNMQLEVHKDTPGFSTSQCVSIQTKSVTTRVLVENGGTIVIGGIYRQDDQDTITKIPLLGDVPVVGNLFKNTVNKHQKRELLVFITPKILRSDSLLQ